VDENTKPQLTERQKLTLKYMALRRKLLRRRTARRAANLLIRFNGIKAKLEKLNLEKDIEK